MYTFAIDPFGFILLLLDLFNKEKAMLVNMCDFDLFVYAFFWEIQIHYDSEAREDIWI